MFVVSNQTSRAIDEPGYVLVGKRGGQCDQMWFGSTFSGGEKLVRLVMLTQPMGKFHRHTNLSVQFSSDFEPQASRHTKGWQRTLFCRYLSLQLHDDEREDAPILLLGSLVVSATRLSAAFPRRTKFADHSQRREEVSGQSL
jgi:hypothetical protein